jgi:hypothetical protein
MVGDSWSDKGSVIVLPPCCAKLRLGYSKVYATVADAASAADPGGSAADSKIFDWLIVMSSVSGH